MESLIAKINIQTSFDEAIFNKFINFVTESKLRPDDYIKQALHVKSPIGLFYIAMGFEYFLPSSNLDSDEFDISYFIRNFPKDVRNND